MRRLWYALIVIAISGSAVYGADANSSAAGQKQAGKKQATQPVLAAGDQTKPAESASAKLRLQDPREMLQIKWDAIIKVLQNSQLDQQAKEAEVERIVIPLIDFPVMAKLAMGKTNWTKMTPDQRSRYQDLFTKRLKNTYRTKIARYGGLEAIVKPALPISKGKAAKAAAKGANPKRTSPKRALYFPVELVSTEGKIAILHKLRKVSGQWKIYDTEIEGVSFLMTYRSQFTDILSSGTIEDLLNRLAEPPAK